MADAVDRVVVPERALAADSAGRVGLAVRMAAEVDQGVVKVAGAADQEAGPEADRVAVLVAGPVVGMLVAVIRETATPTMAAARRRAVVGAVEPVVAERPVVAGVAPAVRDRAVWAEVRDRAVRAEGLVAGEAGAVLLVVAARAVVSVAALALPWI